MIKWREGLQTRKGKQVRQIPGPQWTSSLWITRTGSVWRKRFNVVTQKWTWDAEPYQLSMDNESGRMGVYVGNFMPIDVAIASAWKRRALGSHRHLQHDEAMPLHAKYLHWPDTEDDQTGPIEGETWKPLKYRCGVVQCPSGYEISNFSRLKNPKGAITKGHAFKGSYYAAVRGCGLVNLGVASGLERKGQPPAFLQLAKDCLLSGNTPQALADVQNIALDSAWTYFIRAIPFVSRGELQPVWKGVVDPELRRLLLSMRDDPVLGGSLSDLMAVVDKELPDFSLRSDCPFGELRFARTAIAARL